MMLLCAISGPTILNADLRGGESFSLDVKRLGYPRNVKKFVFRNRNNARPWFFMIDDFAAPTPYLSRKHRYEGSKRIALVTYHHHWGHVD